MATGNLAYADVRREGRDEVHYRVKAFGPDARQHSYLMVNVSPHGMMARCDDCPDVGERFRVNLPKVGTVVAEVRWSLGGRIGCQFERAIDLASYYDLLAVLMKAK